MVTEDSNVGRLMRLVGKEGVIDGFSGCQSVKPSSPEDSCSPGKRLKEVGCVFWPLWRYSVVGQRVTV